MGALRFSQEQKDFGSEGLKSWQKILENHKQTRDRQVYELFAGGLKALDINSQSIPNLTDINKKLMKHTGWQGAFVDGLEDGNSFYRMLANKQFPIGNFIRDKEDLTYTPEPDIVHDLYGHMPFFVDKDYGNFCEAFGKAACIFLNQQDLLRQFERFFWFTIEFGLIKTPEGVRVFGAGIASSTGECAYALSGEPQVLPFDIDVIRRQEFRIDQMQKKLFLLENTAQLYQGLDELVARVKADQKAKE